MKQSLRMTQKLKQTLHLSLSMKQALDILKMNQSDLISCIEDFVNANPVIEYTPSVDMHQYLNEALSQKVTLKEELYMQLHTTQEKYDEKIANFIIESLNEKGFLSYSFAEYIKLLNIDTATFKKTLSIIQSFEPSGVAAQNSIDSISIQLKQQYLLDAALIWDNHQDALVKHNIEQIAKKTNLSKEQVLECIDDIRSCDPFPCRNYKTTEDVVLIPDFEIVIIDDEIQIIPKQIGHIYIDDELKHTSISNELKDYFAEAYYFVDSLNKRNKTLLQMANELVHIQKNYFLFNDERKPCTLQDIANKSGFHESTVSRTLSNKFYLFENEVYPVKSLFVSATKQGSSKDAILKALKKFINEEDKTNPLADYELVEKLSDLELYVSRRAIAKYRDQLHIPNSKMRKQQ